MGQTDTVTLAREALKRGDKATASRLLSSVLATDPRSEVAWVLMSVAVDDPARERECLQRALQINPNNQLARNHLLQLDALPSSSQISPSEPAQAPRPPPPAPPDSPPTVTPAASPATKGKQSRAGKDRVLPAALVSVAALIVLCCICAYCVADSAPSTSPSAKTPSAPARPRAPTPSLADLDIGPFSCRWIDSLGSYKCDGSITNAGTGTWRFVRIRIVVKEKGGRQVGSDWSYMDSDRLVPGATSTWTVYVASSPERGLDHFQTAQIVDGRRE